MNRIAIKPLCAFAQGFILFGALLSNSCALADQTGTAYFQVSGATKSDTFIIALTDPVLIAQARTIVNGTQMTRIHVHGIIEPTAAAYNRDWHFHLQTETIGFFELAAEVCDASTSYVEDHLSEIGGAFLPGRHWCPWASKVIAEVTYDAKHGSHK